MNDKCDGLKFACPECGEWVFIQSHTAKCDACGWMATGAELDELVECMKTSLPDIHGPLEHCVPGVDFCQCCTLVCSKRQRL